MIYIRETLNYSILYEKMNAPWHMAVASKGREGVTVYIILEDLVHIVLTIILKLGAQNLKL